MMSYPERARANDAFVNDVVPLQREDVHVPDITRGRGVFIDEDDEEDEDDEQYDSGYSSDITSFSSVSEDDEDAELNINSNLSDEMRQELLCRMIEGPLSDILSGSADKFCHGVKCLRNLFCRVDFLRDDFTIPFQAYNCIPLLIHHLANSINDKARQDIILILSDFTIAEYGPQMMFDHDGDLRFVEAFDAHVTPDTYRATSFILMAWDHLSETGRWEAKRMATNGILKACLDALM